MTEEWIIDGRFRGEVCYCIGSRESSALAGSKKFAPREHVLLRFELTRPELSIPPAPKFKLF